MSALRTTMQITADKFDRDLFNLLCRAERHSGERQMSDPLMTAEERMWAEACQKISAARSTVRQLMHPADAKGTED